MPSGLPVDAESMNYASVVFVGGLAIAFAWYYIWGRSNYNGPTMEVVEERRTSVRSIPRV